MSNPVNTTILDQRIAPEVLGKWADGIRTHQPDRIASLFTDDAVFQGFDAVHTVGRAGVASYYAKQPVGLTADFRVLELRQLSVDAQVVYARVDFTRPEGVVIPVHLTAVLRSATSGWQISHYHVSKIEQTGIDVPSIPAATERKKNA